MEREIVVYSDDFLRRVRELKHSMHRLYTKIGAEPTPRYDGDGRPIVRKRPDGYDYIVESYMRKKLDEYFPGWSWEAAAPLQFLGSEWVVAQGHLCIPDEHLLAFGIVPPIRKFYGVDAVRVQFRRDAPHTIENIIDIGDNCKQANTGAFKYAVNRLTNIGDDIYGKRIEEEGMGSLEEVMLSTDNGNLQQKLFFEYLSSKNVRTFSNVMKILGVTSFEEITDWKEAYQKIREYY